MADKHVTSLKAWRDDRTEGELLQLPSGNVGRFHRVHVLELVEQGKVPDTLTGLVAQMIGDNPKLRITMDDLQRYADVVNMVVIAAAVEPRVTPEPGEDSLGVREIDFSDRAAIFEWCHIPTRKLQPFRPEEE
jgi:hypothetical protein